MRALVSLVGAGALLQTVLACSARQEERPPRAPSPARRTTDADGFNIAVAIRDGTEGPEFEFRDCVSGAAPARVRSIVVAGGHQTVCAMLWEPGAPAPISRSWRYGHVPEGYSAQECSPLETGVEYAICVDGVGGGEMVFRLADDGSIEVVSEGCADSQAPTDGGGSRAGVGDLSQGLSHDPETSRRLRWR